MDRRLLRNEANVWDSLGAAPTGSEESSSCVVHGQSVDQLPGCGAHGPPLKQREGEGGVV